MSISLVYFFKRVRQKLKLETINLESGMLEILLNTSLHKCSINGDFFRHTCHIKSYESRCWISFFIVLHLFYVYFSTLFIFLSTATFTVKYFVIQPRIIKSRSLSLYQTLKIRMSIKFCRCFANR